MKMLKYLSIDIIVECDHRLGTEKKKMYLLTFRFLSLIIYLLGLCTRVETDRGLKIKWKELLLRTITRKREKCEDSNVKM